MASVHFYCCRVAFFELFQSFSTMTSSSSFVMLYFAVQYTVSDMMLRLWLWVLNSNPWEKSGQAKSTSLVMADDCLYIFKCFLMNVITVSLLLFVQLAFLTLVSTLLQPSQWVGPELHHILSRDLCNTGPCPGTHRVVCHSVAVLVQGFLVPFWVVVW